MNYSYKIFTLGCKVNQYDGNRLSGLLDNAGFKVGLEKCNIVIINTCAVTKNAIHKAKRIINKAKKENPEAKIIISGCWPRVYEEDAKCYADIVIINKDPEIIYEKIMNIFSLDKKIHYCNKIILNTDKSRYFIKIQDGCEQFCSYCIIPYTRGKLKSRKSSEVINEIKEAVNKGYKEIILSGIHLGLYGKEVGNKEKIDLCGLIKKILKIEKLERIRLSSIEVREVTNDLIKLICESDKICKHLHIPLQSGNDKILKLMNRPYDLRYFIDKIEKIRKVLPDVSITTDVIVGFPGENDDDFLDSYNYVNKIKFSKMHIFPFSAHEKTPAFKMENQVDNESKNKRSAMLRDLSIINSREYKKNIINNNFKVVIRVIKKDFIIGKTEYYFDLKFNKNNIVNKGDKIAIGEIVEISKKLNTIE